MIDLFFRLTTTYFRFFDMNLDYIFTSAVITLLSSGSYLVSSQVVFGALNCLLKSHPIHLKYFLFFRTVAEEQCQTVFRSWHILDPRMSSGSMRRVSRQDIQLVSRCCFWSITYLFSPSFSHIFGIKVISGMAMSNENR